MPKLKALEFVDLVKRSGLIDDQKLSEALAGLDLSSIEDSGIVASNLTSAGLLTQWQSENLLNGRHKGFFLGKYRFLDHLGKGGMGSVYLAEHVVMRHQVAIKVLPKHLASQSSYLERFHQEARACALLNHPNIVRAFDVDHEGDNHYLVMEYVAGIDVQTYVNEHGPLPVKLAAEFTRQAAEGLAFAHKAGLVHRDIKPANLLLDKANTIKILDFGLARFSDDHRASLTMEYDEKMIGTVDYLAPEQALDSHAVDSRADLYSLGCTLYFMLTGRAPFPEGTITQRLVHHQKSDPESIAKLRPEVPTDLVVICKRLMAKLPNERFQSAMDVDRELAAWLGLTPKSATTRSFDTTSAPPMRMSQDEDLTLAPLDDEPKKTVATSKPPSSIEKGRPLVTPAKGGSSKKLKGSGSMPVVTAVATQSQPAAPKPQTTHPQVVTDVLDELTHADATFGAPLPTTRAYPYKQATSIWPIVGIGTAVGALVLGGIVLLIWLL